MNQEINEYLKNYPLEIITLFKEIESLIYQTNVSIDAKLWAKLPSYYYNDQVIRLIPFKDHINIEATGIVKHKDELTDFKITPKGMLQIFLKQNIPYEILKIVFTETLLSQNS